MKLIIHRGTKQIGGCVTEIEHNGYKVFIDYGEQLPGTITSDLPLIEGLTCGDISRSALFISHYHGDHIGKICDVPHDIPIYIGKTACEIYRCLEQRLTCIQDLTERNKHKKIVERINTFKTFTPLEKIKIGKITITPLMIDHSAFDAYMFIIEAEGTRLLHTGDFRGHGFRGSKLNKMLQKYASNINYIISEGTNVSRSNVAMQTERELQQDFENQFKQNKYNFVLVSSTNIDRIFSLYHAAKRAGRSFVCDNYQAEILKIVSKNHKRYTPFYDINYAQTENYAGRFFTLKKGIHSNSFLFSENFKNFLMKHGFCMLIRATEAFKPILAEYNAKIYYSMWNGYLDNQKQAYNPILHDFLSSYEIDYMHTSGHADTPTLRTVFKTVKPIGGIIPIHTEAPEKFQRLFGEIAPVITLYDGESFNCKLI